MRYLLQDSAHDDAQVAHDDGLELGLLLEEL
jgi:hypothetical protein